MFYDQENNYKTIDDYINYYNNDRIKVKLKGLSPVKYRYNPLLVVSSFLIYFDKF